MDIEIKRAGNNDLQTIHDMAEVVFRQTYRTILSAEQMEYMMEWMYSLPNLEKQVSQGHTYYIAWADDEPQGMYRSERTLWMLTGQRFGTWRRFMSCHQRKVSGWVTGFWKLQSSMCVTTRCLSRPGLS